MKLKNPKHEAFAQSVADGETATRAYIIHVAMGRCKVTTAMVAGCRLVKDSKVALRIHELRSNASDILEHKLGVTKESVMRVLVEIIETPSDEVGKGHRLLEKWEAIAGKKGKPGYVKTQIPSKLDAIAQLSKMCGWEVTRSQLELTGGPLVEFAKGVLNTLPQGAGLPTHGKTH